MLKSIAILFLSSIVLTGFLSCKKILSCEGNCANNVPVANAGPDQKISLPVDSVLLDGSNSIDSDGKIISYKWIKISGPDNSVIIKPSLSKSEVRYLRTGIYNFELTVTDNGGLQARDTVRVIVDDPKINQPPLADAGADQIITLPTNLTMLDGRASTDPENNIVSYTWSKISGPLSCNILNTHAVQTLVMDLVQGNYQFELKVTDSGGLISKDTMQLTVNNIPPPPINCDTSGRPKGNANLVFFKQLPEPRVAITAVTAVNKIFIAGGYTNYSTTGSPANYSNRIDIYDIISGTWTTMQLSEPRVVGAAVAFNNKIFFAGGYNDNGQRTTVDIYDISTNSWSIGQLSEARGGIAGGTINNKVFFAGGMNFIPQGGGFYTPRLFSTVDIYDAITNSWSTSSLSEPRYSLIDLEKIFVSTVGQKIFFAGGSCNTLLDCSSNKIDIYDASLNSWSNENYVPRPPGWAMFGGLSAGNKNYWVTGDYWEGGNLVEIRDETTHSTTYECLSGTLFSHPINNGTKLIFPVSSVPPTTAGYHLTHFDVLNVTTGSWSMQILPSPGITYPLLNTIVINKEVYIIGGAYKPNGFLSDKIYKLEF